MNEKSYKYLLYLITSVIAITLVIQVYWNYKNYKESERQLKIDLQITLDQSVEDYFTIKAKKNTFSFISSNDKGFKIGKILEHIDFRDINQDDFLKIPDSLDIEGVTVLRGINVDTLINDSSILKDSNKKPFPYRVVDSTKSNFQVSKLSFEDENNITEIQNLTNRIVFSIKSGEFKIEKVDSIFKKQLAAKNIKIQHQFIYKTPDSIYQTTAHSFPGESLTSLSELIAVENSLELNYSGLNMTVLKRNLTGILLSTLLIASIIFCLFYLLNIIKKQKDLNEMKNDLISNITHEFKTPIATTSVALEGVQNFTSSGDTEKTNRYLNMGREQLEKLNNMVEKLLETASLDGKELDIQKGEIELKTIIYGLISKFQPQTSKAIVFNNHSNHSILFADGFHLENAINNLIDNAIKYGGNDITIDLFKTTDTYEIIVVDSGNNLSARDAKHIFNQFYRVPKGNVHDVKGFGIGLYYTNSIIEKHGGSITVKTQPTKFKIVLPYE